MGKTKVAQYKHHLWTGSGQITVLLSFTDHDTAVIDFDLRWMDVGYKGFKIHCVYEPKSKAYGILWLVTIEKLHEPEMIHVEEFDKLVCEPDFPEDAREVCREISFEYFRLPKSEMYIPDDPGYRDMRAFGSAKWNEKFDLILILHFCAVLNEDYRYFLNLKDHDIESLLKKLDKMKFEAI